MSSINTDQLSKEIAKVMEDFAGATDKILLDAVEKTATDTVTLLKETSPKRTGNYAKTWTRDKIEHRNKLFTTTVYNKKNYRLTHLLENGHALRNGGRARAFPHIAPANDKAEEELYNEVVKGIKNL